MKVLFTTQPGAGHFHPLVPLAQGLQQAGHQVLVACSSAFTSRVERSGLQAAAAGVDWLESAPEAAFPEAEGMPPLAREAFLMEIFLDTTASHMAADLLDLCQSWQPDLIVRDAFEYGAALAGECLGIPHVPVDMELYIPPHISRDGMESQLAYLRSAYGLPPYPAMEMLERYGYISYVPPSYQVPTYRLPDGAHQLRPAFLQAGNEALPGWLHDLPDQPTIYATMGTSFNYVPDLIRLIIEGLAQESINLIITVGPGQDPAQFEPTPANVYIEQFIPQTALMPYCDMVIANGGVGTNMIALSSGLPLLLIPLTGHLLLHARRCRELGIGLTLKPPASLIEEGHALQGENFVQRQALALAHYEAPELSPASLRDAVRQILNETHYRTAAQNVQAEINALPGTAYAVELLERLATQNSVRDR